MKFNSNIFKIIKSFNFVLMEIMYSVNKSLNLKKDLVSSEFSKNGYLVIENFIDQLFVIKLLRILIILLPNIRRDIQC